MVNNIFEVFDDKIGVDGYYKIIMDKIFPNSTPHSIDIFAIQLQQRIFRKGATFSRVRHISKEAISEYLDGYVGKDEFYPPKPHKVNVPQGRFNGADKSTFYLADHPFVAMKECDISIGDYFLLSYVKLSIDMCFVFVADGKDDVSSFLHKLLRTKDVRFYSVINKINDDLLTFKGFHGIAYSSTKVNQGHVDEAWGEISTNMNLAIAGKYIKNTDFSVAWLAYCGDKYSIIQHSLFTPLSKKKKNKLARLNFRDGNVVFVRECKKVMGELKEESEKTKRLLAEGYYSEFNQSPIKLFFK